MSNIKNGQILLYFHFNKIIKGPGTSSSLQHWPKIISEMLLIQGTSISPNFILIVLRNRKKISMCKFHYVAMPMMTSQISKSMSFTEAQKSRYLENETLLFIQIKKKIISYTSRDGKNSFVAKATFKIA